MPSKAAKSPQWERRRIDAYRQGDGAAMGELLETYHQRVYHICLRMVNHAEDAAELTQEALLKAIDGFSSFQGNSRFSTWLIRIAMNLCVSHLRKRKLRNTVSLDAPVGSNHSGRPDSPLGATIVSDREPAPVSRVESSEQSALLMQALHTLDTQLRSLIVLRDIQDMDYQQIAETLDWPIGTVKSRLFRARAALRTSVEQLQNPKTRPIGRIVRAAQ